MTIKPKLVDIIIVNYNSTDCVLNCIASLEEELGDLSRNILVLDNASTDNVDRIIARFPNVFLFKNSVNKGFAAGVNQGLKASFSPYVVLLNPDSLVKKNFLRPILNYFEKEPDIGIIGPKILDVDGKVQGSARSFPTPLTAFFGRKSLFTRLFPNNPVTSSNVLTTQSDGVTPMTVDWVSGACMVINRNAIKDVGLLDERFFIYWEDADWCRRMWDAGWKIVYFPISSVVHYVGVSSDQLLIRSQFEFHKSVYLFFDKYNRPPFWLMKFIIMSGLFFRYCFVIVSSMVSLWVKKFRYDRIRPELPMALEPTRPIKVLRMIARLNIGGPAIHVHLLTQGLNKEKFDSTLVTGIISPQEGDMSYLIEKEMKTIVIPELQREISLKMDLKSIIKIYRTLIREKPDIVHTHTAKAGTSARLAAMAYNLTRGGSVRAVHTFHGHIFEGYFSKGKSIFFVLIERLLAKITDSIIAISKTQKEDLAERYFIAPAEKIKTIELGFDLNPFLNSSPQKGHFRQLMGIDKDTFLVGIIGRLVPIKNHRMFLLVAKKLIRMNLRPKIKFVIAGDGELRKDLERFCRQENLTNHVQFCGWIRDVSIVYADLDILALTSLNEGTPVSIIEAMASSVPVIATDVGGVRDLLGNPNNKIASNGFMVCERGILCRNKDISSFANGLSYITKNRMKGENMQVKHARAFVIQRFNKERLLNDIETLYFELMNPE